MPPVQLESVAYYSHTLALYHSAVRKIGELTQSAAKLNQWMGKHNMLAPQGKVLHKISQALTEQTDNLIHLYNLLLGKG